MMRLLPVLALTLLVACGTNDKKGVETALSQFYAQSGPLCGREPMPVTVSQLERPENEGLRTLMLSGTLEQTYQEGATITLTPTERYQRGNAMCVGTAQVQEVRDVTEENGIYVAHFLYTVNAPAWAMSVQTTQNAPYFPDPERYAGKMVNGAAQLEQKNGAWNVLAVSPID